MRPIWLLLAAMAWVIARRRIDVVEVRGRSMAPALLPGDRLLVLRAQPRSGDVVIARDPRDPRRELIKRVHAIGPGGIALRGDNAVASTDARAFGAIPAPQVNWRAVLRYWPPRRAGRLPDAVPLEPIEEGGDPACAFPESLIAGDHAGASVSRARSRSAGTPPPSG